jgi:lambda family phage holin
MSLSGLIGQTMKWIEDFLPSLYAATAAGSISALMSIYDGKSVVKTVTGALSCGILTLSIAGSLELFGLPGNSVTFVGATIGFVGAEKVRDKVLALFNRRIERNSGDSIEKK